MPTSYMTPNANAQPLPEAVAQRRLEAVGGSALFGPALTPEAWSNGS